MQVKAVANFTHPESDKFGRLQHVTIEDVIDVTEEQAKMLVAASLATDDLSWTRPEPPPPAGNPEGERRGDDQADAADTKADAKIGKKK